ncbi:unnamed protein product [Medioppia subpectinata]|uniref:Uncharacterized protein n=1 Tax=Medioppia subpectinata TaxID=1979941 RepID=A0A7R9KFC7_9ACAR|nr:unnamed protein product [Medioppia subpectinata]CAG2102321.1 unnamed protein product [Medioppia subpectinata]
MNVKPFIDKNIIWFTNKSKTISFQIWIVKVDENGVKSTVDMRHESTKQTFVALFDDKDTDFEIVYRNHSCNRMCFGITYGVLSSLKAFESNGHHLRFLSPNLPTGQSVVDMIANKDPDSRRNAEIMCSRMKIALWLDRNPLYGSTIVPNLLSEMTAESDGSDPQIVSNCNTDGYIDCLCIT